MHWKKVFFLLFYNFFLINITEIVLCYELQNLTTTFAESICTNSWEHLDNHTWNYTIKFHWNQILFLLAKKYWFVFWKRRLRAHFYNMDMWNLVWWKHIPFTFKIVAKNDRNIQKKCLFLNIIAIMLNDSFFRSFSGYLHSYCHLPQFKTRNGWKAIWKYIIHFF